MTPLLWHLKVSPYNEKRGGPSTTSESRTSDTPRSPGATRKSRHAYRTARRCERRHPERSLYPRDPDERRLALEHEDYFDEELGPHVRVLFLNCALRHPDLMLGASPLTVEARNGWAREPPSRGSAGRSSPASGSTKLASRSPTRESELPASAFVPRFSGTATSSGTRSASLI